jgi:hypothetical protein
LQRRSGIFLSPAFFVVSVFVEDGSNRRMSPLFKYWTMTGLLALLFCADGLLILYGDMSQGALPVFAAFLFILPVGLVVYSQFMIRCPHCSNRITALVDTRDGKPHGSAPPRQHCRFCGYNLG